MRIHKYGIKGLQTYKSWGRVCHTFTTLCPLCTALPLASKSRVLTIRGVDDRFFIVLVHKFPIIIVSLDVANMLIMVLNNGRQMMDVHVQFLNFKGITLIITVNSSLFTFFLPKIMLLCRIEPDVLIRRIIVLVDMGTSIDRVMGRDSTPPYPTTASLSPTSSSVSRSSFTPTTAATTLVSVNTQYVVIASKVTGLHNHKKFSNMARC